MDGSRRPATWRGLGDGDVGLWVSYDDRHRAKEIPTARWDKHLKCWRIRFVFRDEVEDLVEELNEHYVTYRRTSGGDLVTMTDAFVTMFNVIPITLRKPVHRALVRALHPDMGGDAEVMKAINAAMEMIA